MNENEIKNNNTPNEPKVSTKKETVYEDFEVFDIDAIRKSKNAQTPPSTPASEAKKTPVQRDPQPSQRVPSGVNPQSAEPRQPQQRRPAPKTDRITDVKPDKVVFDSAAQSKRLPKPRRTKTVKEKKQKTFVPAEQKTRGANPVVVLSKALIYIACVLIVSCICAYYIIVVSNDVFAFVKSDAQVEVVIPEYATLDQIAEELHDKNVIKYPKIFVLYTMIRGNDPGKYLSGVYKVSPSQNFDELLYTFIEKKSMGLTEISVTIPEGYTVDDIINLLVNEKGVGTKEGFIDAIQNTEYDYWFVQDLKDLNPNRKYRLEGYLYPDTYYIYKESEETTIIEKMLANFHSKFSAEYKQECEKSGMTVDEIVNLASLIQMEARFTDEYTTVSSVLHNRLNSSYYGRKLESCASIQYILPERKDRITNEDTQIDNPYNTYRNAGLPPGPITNPTLKAIRAALYPEQTSYYFFVNDIEGHMVFSKTYNEHLANKAKIDKEWDALKNG
ncbi:MAG: endolytic transglycosylase MltG [Clostridia bacterium]|nr:endolytic transglycosylase MltG [Clostridia bacterium]